MSTCFTPSQVSRGSLRCALAAALAILPLAAAAQPAPSRLVDQDVKALIEQVSENRGKFQDALSDDQKHAKLRGPNGETDVEAFLKDYEDNINKLKDRFTDDYSASTELATVLRQAMSIDTYMHNSPPTAHGRSEWDREATSLKTLAGAYGTTFPTPDSAPVRRINDKEAAAAAQAIEDAADHFKDNVDKNSTVPQADRDQAKKDADALKKIAETVKSRTEDGKPATAEFSEMLTAVRTLQTFMDSHSMPTTNADWTDVKNQMTKLRQAFGVQ
jgi:hypothetical protein